MFVITWNFKGADPESAWYECPGFECHTVAIAQKQLAMMQAKYPGLLHRIQEI